MENQEKPANKKGRIAVIAAFAVLIAALVVCVALLARKETVDTVDERPSAAARLPDRGVVTDDNADSIMDEMREKVADGMFECRMTTDWAFPDGKSEAVNAYVANVEANHYDIYFDVYESETDELLYSSPVIPVGESLSNFKLDKELEAGKYDAVVMYTLVNEAYEEVSTVGFTVTITVNN